MAQSVTPLDEAHDVTSFDCGSIALNDYLCKNAGQHQRKLISRTYVIADDDAPDVVLGFFTLAIRAMTSATDLPPAAQRRLPREVPGYTLARLAVDLRCQGQGIGTDLIMNAMDRVQSSAENVGGWGFFVDAKDHATAQFYETFGFVRLPSQPLTLFMPIADLPKEF